MVLQSVSGGEVRGKKIVHFNQARADFIAECQSFSEAFVEARKMSSAANQPVQDQSVQNQPSGCKLAKRSTSAMIKKITSNLEVGLAR